MFVDRAQDSNHHQLSEANSGKIQDARSEAYQEERYASDEQRRRLPEFTSPSREVKK
ncbi:MAG: hypothetical protein HYW78_04535 [Parcubacteria group bacterium]|nr:hypothetical protein [Parcubacteria group bacterium]